MALSNSKQNITGTASLLGTPSGGRQFLSVRNPTGSGATIYIGGSNVATDTATIVLAAGDPPVHFSNGHGDPSGALDWYAMTSAGTATGVCVAESD